ncbi:DUF1223 domain-containing protein [Aquabacter sp. L1I39]|uniref:DUF1223 domain-containing protein n=1 Tax=Aquabacter sp. L1I39 TaxID=2820278 RepID=UPI001ADA61E4|nr:DUF1223 domain-containing protein [Aquabacter sp. L1I39]QTL05065.1 DUF1223 domain-containing protein [Aquabacter sp. L1I39]
MSPFRARSLLLALSLAAALQGGAARADDLKPKAVVELFTSQGCASCPPADTLLSELATDPQVIALTLAVDYWDYVGWKDTLAKHGHSLRQRAYADLRGDRMIYTPQMVVDGVVAAKGSDRRAVEKAISRERTGQTVLSVPVKLTREKDALVIELPAAKGHEGASATAGEPAPTGTAHVPVASEISADVWVCPVIASQAVSIGRGENAGKTVTYTNIVRGWIRLGPWTGTAARYEVDMSRLQQDGVDQVVVMVQSGSPGAPGPILGAAKLALP